MKLDKRKGPRSEEVKKRISTANKTAVRGVKMIRKDHLDVVVEELKVGYNNIVEFIKNGWEFKAHRIWMNKDGHHMLKKASDWERHLDEGWTWGTLSHLNKVKCYHCDNYNCKIDHYKNAKKGQKS